MEKVIETENTVFGVLGSHYAISTFDNKKMVWREEKNTSLPAFETHKCIDDGDRSEGWKSDREQ